MPKEDFLYTRSSLSCPHVENTVPFRVQSLVKSMFGILLMAIVQKVDLIQKGFVNW